jgi:phosphoribosylformimino-5-aminoimidazole carboxamide ribotide isomerase
MIVVPAIDLRDGYCVQLLGGDYGSELLRLEDPVSIAGRWRDRGFTTLHVVDLDAATGRGSNAAVIAAICGLENVTVHAGGGVRADEEAARVLAAGASSVLVGTRAVTDPEWFAALATANPGRVSLAVDVRGGWVTTEGWLVNTGSVLADVVAAAEELPLHQVVVTAVDVEGGLGGPDLSVVELARDATRHRLGIAGGISSRADVTALLVRGVDAAIVGTALYTGALTPEGLTEELHR